MGQEPFRSLAADCPFLLRESPQLTKAERDQPIFNLFKLKDTRDPRGIQNCMVQYTTDGIQSGLMQPFHQPKATEREIEVRRRPGEQASGEGVWLQLATERDPTLEASSQAGGLHTTHRSGP
jgi:hypothetical protein